MLTIGAAYINWRHLHQGATYLPTFDYDQFLFKSYMRIPPCQGYVSFPYTPRLRNVD